MSYRLNEKKKKKKKCKHVQTSTTTRSESVSENPRVHIVIVENGFLWEVRVYHSRTRAFWNCWSTLTRARCVMRLCNCQFTLLGFCLIKLYGPTHMYAMGTRFEEWTKRTRMESKIILLTLYDQMERSFILFCLFPNIHKRNVFFSFFFPLILFYFFFLHSIATKKSVMVCLDKGGREESRRE